MPFHSKSLVDDFCEEISLLFKLNCNITSNSNAQTVTVSDPCGNDVG